jgi:hypothetical protein
MENNNYTFSYHSSIDNSSVEFIGDFIIVNGYSESNRKRTRKCALKQKLFNGFYESFSRSDDDKNKYVSIEFEKYSSVYLIDDGTFWDQFTENQTFSETF